MAPRAESASAAGITNETASGERAGDEPWSGSGVEVTSSGHLGGPRHSRLPEGQDRGAPAAGRRLWLISLGPIVAVGAVGLLGAAWGLVPLWLALLPVLVACSVVMRLLRPTDPASGTAEPARPALDSDAGDAGADAGEAATGSLGAGEDVATGTVMTVEAARQRVDAAERAWRALAGPDADPARAEETLGMWDPQYGDARLTASKTPAVRATWVLLETLALRWNAAWAAIGSAGPQPIQRRAVDELAAWAARPVVLAPGVSPRAEAVRAARPLAAVVVTAPVDPAGSQLVGGGAPTAPERPRSPASTESRPAQPRSGSTSPR